MQLKNAFHLITTTNSSLVTAPPPPSHNNNQPFSNVNLFVSDVPVPVALPGETYAEPLVLYSLHDNGDIIQLDNDNNNNNSSSSNGGGARMEDQESDSEGSSELDDELISRRSGGGNSNLNFTPNEFGFLEILSDDDDSEEEGKNGNHCSSESSEDSDHDESCSTVPPDGVNDDDVRQKTISCVTCGCFGLGEEFHDGVHCTHDCALITKITNKKRLMEEQELLRRKILDEEREQMQIKMEQMEGGGNADVELQSMGEVCVKVEAVDEEEGGEEELSEVEAPVSLFRHPALPSEGNPFRVNDLMEAIDPEHQCFFCPARVVEVVGYRLLLKFIGYPDKYNFWVNADSEDIFPVHWTSTYTPQSVSLHFHGPPGFTWAQYIASNPTHRVAPSSCFPHVENLVLSLGSERCGASGIKVGMKLEAVDMRNKSLVCVATVSCVMGQRFLIHFDSWDGLYDYWTTLDSPWVHPIGFCKSQGVEITPPHCYETPSEFDWEEYLKKTSSTPVPQELFRTVPPLPFQPGHLLEVIDKRCPRVVRRGKVAAVNNHMITVMILDDPLYNFELHDTSTDLHPVGWARLTNHPIEDELLPNSNPCPNHLVCRSRCSVRGPEFSSHSKSRDCPYTLANLDEVACPTDRVVIFEDKYYDLGGGNCTSTSSSSTDSSTDEEDKEQCHPPPSVEPPPSKKPRLDEKFLVKQLSPRNSLPINFSTSTTKSLHHHNPTYIPKRSEILHWSHDKISSLVQGLCSNLPTAQKVADQFRNNLIDGESFLMLTQSDMTDALGIKLGPAVKIYNLIRLIDLNK